MATNNTPVKSPPPEGIGNSFLIFLDNIRKYLINLLDLREDTDKQGTVEGIKKYIEIKGYNVWILISAAMIASIGLDNNSAAVIIGAMLISPLMSPILGIGLAFGINDRETLWKSVQNFTVAVVVSILTSFVYFKLTPLGIITPELDARTAPTLLDVFVALFGGIAGIVAGSHKDKTNALPGVAIATALMPPLCTVGFGLAKGQYLIWGGALYLFFINAIVIAFTTYVFVRFLKFPLVEYANETEKRKTALFVTFMAIVISIPSVFILQSTLERRNFNLQTENFVIAAFENSDQFEVIKYNRNDIADTLSILEVILSGDTLKRDTIPHLEKIMHKKYPSLRNTRLEVKYSGVTKQEYAVMVNNMSNTGERLEGMNLAVETLNERMNKMEDWQNNVKGNKVDIMPMEVIQYELQEVYPEITELSGGFMIRPEKKDSTVTMVQTPSVNLKWSKIKESTKKEYEKRIDRYLRARFNYDTIIINRMK